MTSSTPDTSLIKLTCRCSAPTRPLACVGGCSYLCQRLMADLICPGFFKGGPVYTDKGDDEYEDMQDRCSCLPGEAS